MPMEAIVEARVLADKWDESYERYENTLFFPSEGVIRFVNRHIRRRTGVDSYTRDFETPPAMLEIGSGAGRHLTYLVEAGFRPTGIELSAVACNQAVNLLTHNGIPPDSYQIINCSASDLPLDDRSFDYAISVATLDSMPTGTARMAIAEVHRALKPGALFFVDLIGDDAVRPGDVDTNGDQLVSEQHELGTVQSYFNISKINELFEDFAVRDLYKLLTVAADGTVSGARYYLTLEKP